ncbi:MULTISPECIES: hypothetical protein [unclassified Luteimonas]|uniref:hypothetical protein n=1 Tax=unclassified Luteimonas TaxID=2629088 RepID=UPI00160122E7|nr:MULTISPECIES: hypothetical protein [unclassified Luteimonas]MBB1472811.1 hypothetical protein [Luteimonas sp. MC1782]MBB6598485.1 hypothetical protein [Luteimonas sp. MC1825]QOC88677.1 hypothetical protein IDM46_02665 [Luteimonas sp. MC1825]
MRALIFSFLVFAATSTAFAKETVLDLKAKPFAEQAEAIKVDLATGVKYREISNDDRNRVSYLLNRMGSRIEEAGGVDRLPPLIQVDVFNDQESVNTILTRASEDSRMVCRREKTTGTNATTNRCMTVADRRRHSEASREWLRKGVRQMAPGN